jgi:hypothetical protein
VSGHAFVLVVSILLFSAILIFDFGYFIVHTNTLMDNVVDIGGIVDHHCLNFLSVNINVLVLREFEQNNHKRK